MLGIGCLMIITLMVVYLNGCLYPIPCSEPPSRGWDPPPTEMSFHACAVSPTPPGVSAPMHVQEPHPPGISAPTHVQESPPPGVSAPTHVQEPLCRYECFYACAGAPVQV